MFRKIQEKRNITASAYTDTCGVVFNCPAGARSRDRKYSMGDRIKKEAFPFSKRPRRYLERISLRINE